MLRWRSHCLKRFANMIMRYIHIKQLCQQINARQMTVRCAGSKSLSLRLCSLQLVPQSGALLKKTAQFKLAHSFHFTKISIGNIKVVLHH